MYLLGKQSYKTNLETIPPVFVQAKNFLDVYLNREYVIDILPFPKTVPGKQVGYQ